MVVISWPLGWKANWGFKLKLLRQTYVPLLWPPFHHGLWRYYQKREFKWIAEPISPYQLGETRRKTLSQSPSVPYHFDPSDPPGVALLFLVLDGIDHPSLWQRWMEDAFQYLRHITDPDLNVEDYLTPYVHHPPWVDRKIVVEGTPQALQRGILKETVNCAWGNLNPCVARLLGHALRERPHAQWFIMVSPDAVPLKSFKELYTELMRDRRTRMTFIDLYFHLGMPRVCNWFVLSRAHTETMIRRQEEWMDGRFIFVTGLLQGAADEYDFFWPLLDEYGEGLFRQINPGLQLTNRNAAWKQMSTPLYNCWRSIACLEVGDMQPYSEPARYLSLFGEGLRPLLEDPPTFFLRKVNRDAVVYLSDNAALFTSPLQYLTEKLNLSSTALHPALRRKPLVMPPGYKEAGMQQYSRHTAAAYGHLRRESSPSDDI